MDTDSRRAVAGSFKISFVAAALSLSAGLGAPLVRAQEAASVKKAAKPLYVEYKGVRLGMATSEVHKKLGEPKETSVDQETSIYQEMWAISDTESAQVYYVKGLVTAVSVGYFGQKGAPTPKTVLGVELEAKPDGGMETLVRYPDAGYWVSYSRTAGDDPLITVTMQKMP